MALYQLIKGFIPAAQVEDLIRETFLFKQLNYNETNLERHAAYLSDTTPHRTSSAYAVSTWHPFNAPPEFDPLPTLNLSTIPETPTIWTAYMRVRKLLGLDEDNRVLFNVQEYYGGSEAVPRHSDGELLDFTTEGGTLNIKRSIRPDMVAVLTLVNDTDGNGGTKVHNGEGDSSYAIVRGEPGDLLVFNNVECDHSVDPLQGTVKRVDGLLRMTIGFRSLASRCHYMEGKEVWPISKREAELLTKQWYNNDWPAKWAAIKGSAAKAAF